MMVIPKELQSVLVSTPDALNGSVRFTGTRVPVKAFLDAISAGRSLDQFIEGHPGVTKEQALAVLRWEQNQARETFGLELVH